MRDDMILECFYRQKGGEDDAFINKKHSHEKCYELIQTISSGGNFVIKDTLYPIGNGVVFLINAIDVHCSVPENLDIYVRNKLVLNSEILDEVASLMGFEHIVSDLFKENKCASVTLPPDETEQVDDIFEGIYNLYSQNDPNNRAEMYSHIFHFLQICFNNHNENQYAVSSCVTEAMRYINENIADDITLTRLSKALFVTKNHLCKQFKKNTAMTVIEYIKLRRISMAKKKLQFTDMSIADIAQFCGFDNASYFSKLFKKYEGMTPMQYRMRYTK